VIGRMRSLFEIFDFAVLSVNSDTSIPSARDRWVRN